METKKIHKTSKRKNTNSNKDYEQCKLVKPHMEQTSKFSIQGSLQQPEDKRMSSLIEEEQLSYSTPEAIGHGEVDSDIVSSVCPLSDNTRRMSSVKGESQPLQPESKTGYMQLETAGFREPSFIETHEKIIPPLAHRMVENEETVLDSTRQNENHRSIIHSRSSRKTDFDFSSLRPFDQQLDTENAVSPEIRNQPCHFSTMGNYKTKISSKANSWSEFNKEHDDRMASLFQTLSIDEPSLTKHIQHVNEMSEILDAITISHFKSVKDLATSTPMMNVARTELMFDVHQPNPSFRKSQPGEPHLRVLVVT